MNPRITIKKTIILSIISLLLLTILLSGCTTEKTYDAPTNITNTEKELPSEAQGNILDNISFNMGETATDGKLAVTVHDVKYVKNIDEVDNLFVKATAPAGKKFVVVDMSVENLTQDKSFSMASIFQAEIGDSEGYTYQPDFMASTALEKDLGSGEIVPGQKRRGAVAFLIDENSTNLKLFFKYELFSGSTAVFNLVSKKTVFSTKFDKEPNPTAELTIGTIKYDWTTIPNYGGTGSFSMVDVTVNNTGKVSFMPAFDVTILKNGNEVSTNPNATGTNYDSIKTGEEKTISLITFTIIDTSGEYEVKVDLRENGKTEVIDSKTKNVEVK
ncbi:MAG: DUF4352 domain-containing protein [archaeon]